MIDFLLQQEKGQDAAESIKQLDRASLSVQTQKGELWRDFPGQGMEDKHIDGTESTTYSITQKKINLVNNWTEVELAAIQGLKRMAAIELRFRKWANIVDEGNIRSIHRLNEYLEKHSEERLEVAVWPTVCMSARCPNRGECFAHHTATFLILGDICTWGCKFCAVQHGKPLPPADDEPERLAQAVKELGLSHVVITSVTRDDLSDGGARHYAAVTRKLHSYCQDVKIELLVPDFSGSTKALSEVLSADPEILAHNVETVPRLYEQIRCGAEYKRSVELIRNVRAISPDIITKSGLMLGLGEQEEEVLAVLNDLHAAGCDMITLGQYLAPSRQHAPVVRYVRPEEFAALRQKALIMGFKSVAAGPLVRSSYKASVFFKEIT